MTNQDELMLITPFDQSIETDDLSILDRIDDILKEAIEKKNAFIALNACKSLIQVTKISGLGLAKILYFIYTNWDKFEVDDDFEDVVYEYVGLHKYTVSRYVRVWSMHQEKMIPEKFEKEILQRNIQDQIPIATAIKQGYVIEEQDWSRLANASDYQEVAQIVREDIKGKERRKGTLQLFIDKRGSIWAMKEGDRKFVGSLEVQDDDEMVQQAIQRIISNSGIRENS